MPALLLILLALPLLAAGAVASLGRGRAEAARVIALFAVLINLGLTVAVVGWAYPRLAARATEVPSGAAFRPVLVPGAAEKGGPTTKWDVIPLGTAARPGQPVAAIQFYVGVDGLNLWLVALTSLLMLSAVLASWDAVTERANEYYAWLLVLNTGMLGVFVALDLILFYVFFELTLIPLFFLVGIWGGPARREAAGKLFLYTLAGSLVTLVGMLVAAASSADDKHPATFAIPELAARLQDRYRQAGEAMARDKKDLDQAVKEADADPAAKNRAEELGHRYRKSREQYGELLALQAFLFFTLVVGFAVKVPLVPLHTWLPLAYAEAPYPVTFLLSAVLAKMGTYGLLRICLPVAPDAALLYGLPVLGALCVVGIVYGALCAFGQADLKRLLAYSSVSHLGFCVLGLLALTTAGVTGGVLHMLNHGLATGALFLLVGMLADRYAGVRRADAFSGLAARYHVMALLVMLMALSSVGLPGLNNFVSEMLMLGGVVEIDKDPAGGTGWVFALGAAAGVVLGAWYTMTMLRDVFFGPLKEPAEAEGATDLNARELTAVLPLVAACVVLGVFPQPALDPVRRDANVVVTAAGEAWDRAGNAGLLPATRRRPEPASGPAPALAAMPRTQAP